MVNALHSGSEYTKALFLYLYKTYYKQEYKTLKRFRSISRDELLSLSDSEDRDASFIGNMARILFIARLLGIEINADCHVVYVYVKHRNEATADSAAILLGSYLSQVFAHRVLGPDRPAVARVKTLSIRKLVVKLETGVSLRQAKAALRVR